MFTEMVSKEFGSTCDQLAFSHVPKINILSIIDNRNHQDSSVSLWTPAKTVSPQFEGSIVCGRESGSSDADNGVTKFLYERLL